MTDSRLDELEVRLTFLDDAMASLIDADADRSRRLMAIERALADLRAELAGLRSAVGHDAKDEPPPPHY